VPQTLNEWVKRVKVDTGARDGFYYRKSAACEGAGARQQATAPGQRDLKLASAFFAQAEPGRRLKY